MYMCFESSFVAAAYFFFSSYSPSHVFSIYMFLVFVSIQSGLLHCWLYWCKNGIWKIEFLYKKRWNSRYNTTHQHTNKVKKQSKMNKKKIVDTHIFWYIYKSHGYNRNSLNTNTHTKINMNTVMNSSTWALETII